MFRAQPLKHCNRQERENQNTVEMVFVAASAFPPTFDASAAA